MKITVEFPFSSAHRLLRYQGPCFHLHGHNYVLLVTLHGEIDPATGMLMDFHELEAIVQEHVLQIIDHRYLNDILENPTAEELAVWIGKKLLPVLPNLAEIKLYETPQYFVTLTREEMR